VLEESRHLEINTKELSWLLFWASLLLYNNLDHDWAGEFVDFPPDENDAPPLLASFEMEDPIAKLCL
jgi:hypothetical protein